MALDLLDDPAGLRAGADQPRGVEAKHGPAHQRRTHGAGRSVDRVAFGHRPSWYARHQYRPRQSGTFRVLSPTMSSIQRRADTDAANDPELDGVAMRAIRDVMPLYLPTIPFALVLGVAITESAMPTAVVVQQQPHLRRRLATRHRQPRGDGDLAHTRHHRVGDQPAPRDVQRGDVGPLPGPAQVVPVGRPVLPHRPAVRTDRSPQRPARRTSGGGTTSAPASSTSSRGTSASRSGWSSARRSRPSGDSTSRRRSCSPGSWRWASRPGRRGRRDHRRGRVLRLPRDPQQRRHPHRRAAASRPGS